VSGSQRDGPPQIIAETGRPGPLLCLRLLWYGAKGARRLRGALFVAATFDPDQRNRLILVNAKGPLGTVALLSRCKRLQLAPQ